MQANLGVEAQPPTPGLQNVTLYPYVNPATEIIDGTNLPKNAVTYDANGNPVSDVKITPISDANDGTQIWRITHNGVDTHPIHFHLYDVQMLNRVDVGQHHHPARRRTSSAGRTPSASARSRTPSSPCGRSCPRCRSRCPNSDPQPEPDDADRIDERCSTTSTRQGNPTAPITNQLVNFGWEYVWHCHILSHEEMDMMRPQTLVLPPVAPSGLTNTLSGTGTTQQGRADLERQLHHRDVVRGAALDQPRRHLDHHHDDPVAAEPPNIHQTRTYTDPSTFNPTTTMRYYRVLAQNTVGLRGRHRVPADDGQSNSNTRVVGPSFTITASAGAGGTISPTGTVAVGRGGSQTFTITPNAGYRIATVLVDGVNNADGGRRPAPTRSPTCRPPHTISVDVHAEPRPPSPRVPGPAAASRRTARRRWRSAAARPTRSRRTPATSAPPCWWTASTTRRR